MMQYLYWTIQIANYIIFMTLDLMNQCADISNKVKFFSIVLCFLYALFNKKEKRSVYLCTGLFFTVIADYFLVLHDSQYGIIVFCIVQTIYSWWLCKDKHEFKVKIGIILISLLILLGVIVGIFKVTFAWILLFLFYYFMSIVSNVVVALRRRNEKYERKLFALGMVLFLCCDINVAILNVEDFLTISNGMFLSRIVPIAQVAIWFFYLPSQLLIAYVARNVGRNQSRNKKI